MGQGMANNLLLKYKQLVVYTRKSDKITNMIGKGATGASSIEDITTKTDIVFTCLPNIATSRDIIIDRIAKVAKAEQIVVDHSTVNRTTSIDCYTALKNNNAHFLDAPISGGPVRAQDGTLSIMVGGEYSAFTIAKPFMDMMGTTVSYLGNSSSGTAMKLVNQLLVGVHALAAAEAFAFANSAKLDISTVASILNVSWGSSEMVKVCAPVIESRNFANSPSPIRNLDKDLKIIAQECLEQGLDLKLLTEALTTFSSLAEQGKGNHALATAIELIEKRSKAE